MTTQLVAFVDQHRDQFGVEPICRVLKIAPSTYYAAKSRPPSARKLRDNQLESIISELFAENAWSVRKMWHTLRHRGEPVGRDQVARLMRELGFRGTAGAKGRSSDRTGSR